MTTKNATTKNPATKGTTKKGAAAKSAPAKDEAAQDTQPKPEKTVLPGHETQSDEMNCPACGRFVGAVGKCPYCGAKVAKRMSLTATRWAAVLLATVGLFLLYLMARYREVPVVELGKIEPTMNFGQIRVVGTVATDAKPFRSGRGMSFNVNDGTGQMVVFTTERQMNEMAEKGLTPRAGDKIEFNAQLNLSDDKSNLKLSSLNNFKLEKAPAKTMRLADLHAGLAGQSVQISGKVESLTPPPEGTKKPYVLELSDKEGGKATVNFWPGEYEQIPGKEGLVPGAWVQLRTAVKTYQKAMQLKLEDGKDLEILEKAEDAAEPDLSAAQKAAKSYAAKTPAQKRDFSRGRKARAAEPIASVTADRKDETVKVEGAVIWTNADKRQGNQPHMLSLKDEAGDTIYVKYWDNLAQQLEEVPQVGESWSAEGRVEVWNGKASIQVKFAEKLAKTAGK